MARKKIINNSGIQINGSLTVRQSDQPGVRLNSVPFTVNAAMGTQLFVDYGDSSNPYVDAFEISGISNGGIILSNQIIETRGSGLDDKFNTNDTITITQQNFSLITTTSNTWT